MGANEKQETTYHGAEYTPEADAVESSYVHQRSHRVTLIEAHHEFTRFIAKIRAEAKAEALEEAAQEIRASEFWVTPIHNAAQQIRLWLRARANQIRKDK
ncbi:hypothetical protein [Glutamicibacter ardleyensis]|uniref:hypothetical protein n=1 Tax=Glutamicibacter ardleyensis TaxID=225894 RepID=UPI003FD11757